jgi:hypothetical protein
MEAAHFASEADFQRLLSDFPELLAGDQMDVAKPRRFLLIDQEQRIGLEEGGFPRWSLDHLFLDQDGIPTLVEVKRQTDTRIRREVVGQMLDYAANCDAFWSAESLRAHFVGRCEAAGQDPQSLIASHIGPEQDPDAFWAKVKTNLQAGRIRMLFVADRIPQELRRIIEFLNLQMQPAEVLGVELRQYEGEGLKALAPVVIGRSQNAADRKGMSTGPKGAWDEARILDTIASLDEPNAPAAARDIIAWCHANASRVQITSAGAVGPVFETGTDTLYPFLISPDGSLTIYLGGLAKRPAFEAATVRDAFRLELNKAPGVSLPADAIVKQPRLALADFPPSTTQGFLRAMDWFKAQLG